MKYEIIWITKYKNINYIIPNNKITWKLKLKIDKLIKYIKLKI